jgi:hypothetical protein
MAGSRGPLWTSHGADRRALEHSKALTRVGHPATLGRGSSPVRAKVKSGAQGSHIGPHRGSSGGVVVGRRRGNDHRGESHRWQCSSFGRGGNEMWRCGESWQGCLPFIVSVMQ